MSKELEKFKRVNNCETIEELCQCIRDFADENGEIKGRNRVFNADHMASYALFYYENGDKMDSMSSPNFVTREFGLRQQLLYLKYYKYK